MSCIQFISPSDIPDHWRDALKERFSGAGFPIWSLDQVKDGTGGPAEENMNNPKEPYTKALMAAAFELKADESGVVST